MKAMKKFLSLVLVLMLVLSSVTVLADGSVESDGETQIIEEERVDETEELADDKEEAGEPKPQAEKKLEETALATDEDAEAGNGTAQHADPHTWVHKAENDKAATCTDKGYEYWVCSQCGEVQQREVPAKGHERSANAQSEVKTTPTCTETGIAVVTSSDGKPCKNCDVTSFEEVIKANGHTYASETDKDYKEFTQVIDPTCTEDGKIVKKCKVCGHEETEPNGKKFEHKDPETGKWALSEKKEIAVHPTCVEKGKSGFGWYCTLCGEVVLKFVADNGETQEATLTYIDELEHNFSEWSSILNGASEEVVDGKKTGRWLVDASASQSLIADGKPHTTTATWKQFTAEEVKYEVEYVFTPATCTEDGSITMKCLVDGCGKTATFVIEKTGHNWEMKQYQYYDEKAEQWVDTDKPDCTKNGMILYECTICHEQYNQEIVGEKTHKWATEDTEAHPWKYYQKKFFDSKEEEYNANTVARCYEYTYSRPCVNPWCQAYETEKHPGKVTTSHVSEGNYEVTDPATCTENGLHIYQCANCNYPQSEEIESRGHWFDTSKVTTAATCTTEGVRTWYCHYDPSHTKTEPIPALGHTEVEVVKVAGDCDHDRIVEIQCSFCKAILREENRGKQHVVNKDDKNVTRYEATCLKDGSYSGYCSDCHQLVVVTEEGSMKEHRKAHLTLNVTVKNATCTTDRVEQDICDDPKCGYKSEQRTIEGTKLGHLMFNEQDNIKNFVITKYPTCETEGECAYICGRAGCNTALKNQPLPKLKHNYVTLYNAEKNQYEVRCVALTTGAVDTYLTQNYNDGSETSKAVKAIADYVKAHGYNWMPQTGVCSQPVKELPVVKPVYDIAVSGETVKIKLHSDKTEAEAYPLKETILRLSWNYTLEDGTSFTYICPPLKPVSVSDDSDDEGYHYTEAEYEFIQSDVPDGATYNGMTVIVCDSTATARLKKGSDANKGYGATVVK